MTRLCISLFQALTVLDESLKLNILQFKLLLFLKIFLGELFLHLLVAFS